MLSPSVSASRPLPLVVISDLDCHSTNNSPTLHRLLHALPPLDFARLKCTPVANGIEIDAIWKMHDKISTKTISGVLHANLGLRSSGIQTHLTTGMFD